MNRIRVLVVDDHQVLAENLARAIDSAGDMRVCPPTHTAPRRTTTEELVS